MYTFPIDAVYPFDGDLRKYFEETLDFIAEKFKNWRKSPYRNRTSSKIAEAVFDLEKRAQLLRDGFRYDDFQEDIRYYKIAPGERDVFWSEWREKGYISIGWDEFGDLTGISRIEFEIRRDRAIAENPDWTVQGCEQIWEFHNIREGDRIVANKGISEILGIGTVTGSYYFEEGVSHGHRIPVRWDDTVARKINKGHWVRTLMELDQDEFGEIAKVEDRFFDERTFQLLEELHRNPTQDFYNEHKEEYRAKVEQPFQDLMKQSVSLLRKEVVAQMETEKKLFSRFQKNDFGKKGTWDYYWGAFYPKGSKRTTAAQLSLWINYERLEIGFYIGNYGKVARNRFRKNCQENRDTLLALFEDIRSDSSLVYGSHKDVAVSIDGQIVASNKVDFVEWLTSPEKSNYDISVMLPKKIVLSMSSKEMVEMVAVIYNRLFPLVILASSDSPMNKIADYKRIEEEKEKNPRYTIEELSQETGVEISRINSWIKAINRKGQAILYGPPGTGKTFVSEKLARHLIADGDGFVDTVQFHPAYAYEDFIQGIRPKNRPDGSLEYPLLPGRFLEFCEQASYCEGKCVLIIDEINRANLARVFGELMYLLEYRNKTINLAGGEIFAIPSNVRIIGTMNTADRSIALVDHALRRRFAFLALWAEMEILRKYHMETGYRVDGLIRVLEKLNSQIDNLHYSLGISYFLLKDLDKHIEDIWMMEIEPYIIEYFFDNLDVAKNFSWAKVRNEILS